MKSDRKPLRSYEDIGRDLGISPARVRQLEQRALEKLRWALAKQGVCSFDGERDPVCDFAVARPTRLAERYMQARVVSRTAKRC
jgi:hypothetical protein